MLQGHIPYVDLLEHKGPYMYALSGIGYLLSPKGFQGYFLFELISMFFFALYSYKTIKLYTEHPALWVLPFLCAGVMSAKSFVHGGSLEELSLGIFAYAIYSLLTYLRDERKGAMPAVALGVNGLFAGILFWSKFTLLGLYMVWITVLAVESLRREGWRRAFRNIAIFLGILSATTIPWLIYFGVHHAIVDWLKIYLWDNIFGYAQWGGESILEKLQMAFLNTLRSLMDRENGTYSAFVALGALFYVCSPVKRVSWKEKLAVGFMGLFMGLGIFIGETKHDYYGLPLSVFSMFGGIGLAVLAGRVGIAIKKVLKRTIKIVYTALLLLILVSCARAVYWISPNTYLISVEQWQMPQFKFAEKIQESSDRSILNYGFLDGGFYTVLGEVPDMRVFCIINRNQAELLEEQNNYVREGRTHFIVTWRAYPISREELMDNSGCIGIL